MLGSPGSGPSLDAVTDMDLQRYLRARKGSVAAACSAVRASLEWRAKYDCDRFMTGDFPDYDFFDIMAPSA